MEAPPSSGGTCANCLIKMKGEGCSEKIKVTCAGCSVVQYCSKVCQAEHHPSHHSICSIFSGKVKLQACQTTKPDCRDEQLEEELRLKSNILVRLYWQKFGYFQEEEEENPRQCPYLLGEQSGQFVGWIDEYLSHLDDMLTTSIRASSRKWQKIPRVVKNYLELQSMFLDLRSWYWFYKSLVKNETPEIAEVLFAEVLFAVEDNSAYEILDNYMQGCGFQALSWWEAFLDTVGRFYNGVRMAKYSIINLGQ